MIHPDSRGAAFAVDRQHPAKSAGEIVSRKGLAAVGSGVLGIVISIDGRSVSHPHFGRPVSQRRGTRAETSRTQLPTAARNFARSTVV